MEFAFKVDGQTYKVGALTLGTSRMVAREFGVRDIKEFDWSNPDYLAAIVYLGFRDARPDASHEALLAEVDSLDLSDLVGSIAEAVASELEKAEAAQVPPSRAEKATPKKRTAKGEDAGS